MLLQGTEIEICVASTRLDMPHSYHEDVLDVVDAPVAKASKLNDAVVEGLSTFVI